MWQKLIIGNWKMNGSIALIDSLLPALTNENFGRVRVVVCPPMAYLAAVSTGLAGSAVQLGAQNVSDHESGAYTGETAASMFMDLGCTYVLVGHSERRYYFGESNELVGRKYAATVRAGPTPVLCIGETESEHDKNQTEEVVCQQVDAVLNTLGAEGFVKGVIAYEPRWAIGTGNTATPAHAQMVHELIRRHIARSDAEVAQRVPVVYGGSMKASNAADLLAMPDVDGGLVGGASLDSAEFVSICRAAATA